MVSITTSVIAKDSSSKMTAAAVQVPCLPPDDSHDISLTAAHSPQNETARINREFGAYAVEVAALFESLRKRIT